MATPLGTRRESYMDRYQRVLGSAYRVEQIRRDIQNEQDRVQYLDSLIAQENQTSAALREIFSVPQDYSEAQRLLKERAELDRSLDLQTTATTASNRRSRALPDSAAEQLNQAILSGSAPSIKSTAENIMRGATPERAQKVIDYIRERQSRANLSAGDYTGLEAFRTRFSTSTGVSGPDSSASEGREEAFAESLEAAFFAGPDGIRGGYDGLEIVEYRKLTPAALRDKAEMAGEDEQLAKRLEARAKALEDSEFATAKEAYDAALAIVRATGNPSLIEDEYARTVYEEAREARAYRNDERPDFEEEVLSQRQRVAALETEKEQLQSRYDDPAQEGLKRELIARGYKFYDGAESWKNQYAQYQMTPDYDVYIGAYERYQNAIENESPIAPSSRAENIVTSYTMMLERRNMPITIPVLRKQLEKAGIKGREQDNAISFAMAYYQAGGPEQDPAMLRLQREDERIRAKEIERAKADREIKDDEIRLQRDVVAQLEEDQRQAVGDLRDIQKGMDLQEIRNLYTRLRVEGLSVEQARERVQREVDREPSVIRRRAGEPVSTAEAAGRILTEPDLMLERDRRMNVERERRAALRDTPEIELAPSAPQVDLAPNTTDAQGRPLSTARGREIVYDPDGALSYVRAPSGNSYLILKNGVPTGQSAARGSRAFDSIDGVRQGNAPLPVTQTPTPPPTPQPTPAPAPPAPAPAAPAPPETDAEREARIRREIEARRAAQQ